METVNLTLKRLNNRVVALTDEIVPQLDGEATAIYARIMPLPADNHLRIKLEAEYVLLSKELKLRSKELVSMRHEIENLEIERKRKQR
ncbi:MAG: hypothetical protein ACI8PP_003002 [Candidatus Pseudothioglobus sp.]|jgi:hypothetical protein